MKEIVNEIKDALEDMSSNARLIFSHLEDLEDYNDPIIEYVNELDKDLHIYLNPSKRTLEQVCYDLMQLIKEQEHGNNSN